MKDIAQKSFLYSLHGKDYLWKIEKDAFWKYVSEHVTIPAQCPAFSLNLSFSLGVFEGRGPDGVRMTEHLVIIFEF